MSRFSKDEILKSVLSIEDEKKQCEMFVLLIQIGASRVAAMFSQIFSSNSDICGALEKLNDDK